MEDKSENNLIIDESMIKNMQEYNLIKDEVSCEICSGVLIKSKQCQSCESIYCEKCINEWKNKNNSCPKRCSKIVLVDPPKLLKKLLDKISIQCSYCKRYQHTKCIGELQNMNNYICIYCQMKYSDPFIHFKDEIFKCKLIKIGVNSYCYQNNQKIQIQLDKNIIDKYIDSNISNLCILIKPNYKKRI